MTLKAVAVVFFIFSAVSSSFSQGVKEKAITQRISVEPDDSSSAIDVSTETLSAEAVLAKEATHQAQGKDLKILYRGFSLAPLDQAPLKKTPYLLPVEEVASETPKERAQNVEIRPERFDWDSAIHQSLFFLGIQHLSRLTQEKTVEALRGPLFRDYVKSIKGIKGWSDGDGFVTNYLGHPMMGAISGFIQIHNDPKAAHLRLSKSKAYWKSRAKALAWSAAYSTQFEIGMLSEATIGNVGKKPGTSGYVDFVVTPTLGTVAIVLEDAADKYLIEPIERRTRNWHIVRLVRIMLNPTRSFANLLRLKKPWYRERTDTYLFGRNQRP
jgi:hypothetical protein